MSDPVLIDNESYAVLTNRINLKPMESIGSRALGDLIGSPSTQNNTLQYECSQLGSAPPMNGPANKVSLHILLLKSLINIEKYFKI